MELTVLGCSGSFGAPGGGACSGYLVRTDTTSVWVDCGNGTFGHLQEHLAVEDLTAVVLTHGHPDHCVDIYGLHVLEAPVLQFQGVAAGPGPEVKHAAPAFVQGQALQFRHLHHGAKKIGSGPWFVIGGAAMHVGRYDCKFICK